MAENGRAAGKYTARSAYLNHVRNIDRKNSSQNTVEQRKKQEEELERNSKYLNQDSSRVQSTIHQGKASQLDKNFDESRKSFDQRSQLRENILQQMKEPKMPVYYENPDTRYSLLSEMVQA